jgi:hypothetical protein
MRRSTILLALLLTLALTLGLATSVGAAPPDNAVYYATLRAFGGDGTGPEGYLTASRVPSGDILVRVNLYFINRPSIRNVSIQRGFCGTPSAAVLRPLPAFSLNPWGFAQLRYLLPVWEWREVVDGDTFIVVNLANVGPNNPTTLCGQLQRMQ